MAILVQGVCIPPQRGIKSNAIEYYGGGKMKLHKSGGVESLQTQRQTSRISSGISLRNPQPVPQSSRGKAMQTIVGHLD